MELNTMAAPGSYAEHPAIQALQSLLDRPDLDENVRAQAMQLMRGFEPTPTRELPGAVQARLVGLQERAQNRVNRIDSRVKQRADQLLQAALRAGTAAKRVQWLQRSADVLGQGYAPVAACRSGCAHCCRIPVKISQVEAQVMGKALGRAPLPPGEHSAAPATDDWTPCTFLKDYQCSIYAHRPAVCRSHLNLDQDDLLCRPVPGASAIPRRHALGCGQRVLEWPRPLGRYTTVVSGQWTRASARLRCDGFTAAAHRGIPIPNPTQSQRMKS